METKVIDMEGKGMIKIAICDDDVIMTSTIDMIVAQCFESKSEYEVDIYFSADWLNSVLEEHRYNIYILDIEMQGMNGLELARSIRKKDEDAVIIFMTSYSDYMQRAFDVRAFNFLNKPIDEVRAKQVILKAIAFVEDNRKNFIFKKGRTINAIYYRDILYLESVDRFIVVHTEKEDIKYYGRIRELMNSLNCRLFARVHNSYIINMNYVKTIEKDKVILKDDTYLTLSKKYIKCFNQQYQNYILSQMES